MQPVLVELRAEDVDDQVQQPPLIGEAGIALGQRRTNWISGGYAKNFRMVSRSAHLARAIAEATKADALTSLATGILRLCS